jgi:hypothetical protein
MPNGRRLLSWKKKSTLLTGLQVLKINNVIMSGDDDNEF